MTRPHVDRRQMSRFGWATFLVLAIGCRASGPTAATTNGVMPAISSGLYDPAHDLGPLFHDVQLARVFPDSKTFVDARPRSAPSDIAARYAAARTAPGFDLHAFVAQNFEPPRATGESARSDTAQSMEEHIRALWPALTRPADSVDPRSSLIPLPEGYVVPGGRFREVYYWDSYFTMLGLVQSGRFRIWRPWKPSMRSGWQVPNRSPRALRHAVWFDSATDRSSTATGTTGQSPGLNRIARISNWRSVFRRYSAKLCIATSGLRPKVDGISRADGCVIPLISVRSKRRSWPRWI